MKNNFVNISVCSAENNDNHNEIVFLKKYSYTNYYSTDKAIKGNLIKYNEKKVTNSTKLRFE